MAKYQPMPNGEKRCDNCIQFIAETHHCRIVKGEVAPEGYCSLWAKQSGT